MLYKLNSKKYFNFIQLFVGLYVFTCIYQKATIINENGWIFYNCILLMPMIKDRSEHAFLKIALSLTNNVVCLKVYKPNVFICLE